jgi:hypothetical protein
MFGKRCSKCEKKVNRKFDFCPYCANPLKQEDYGLLGSSDDIQELNNIIPQNLGMGIGSSIFEKMLSGAMKMVEKEINNISKKEAQLDSLERQARGRTNFELFINGRRVNLPGNIEGIQIEEAPVSKRIKQQQIQKNPKISETLLKHSQNLPRKEAKSRVIRTTEKITYELDVPGLDSRENVLINKLESSLEIKVYTKKAVYFKALPIKAMPKKYFIKEEKLILEFGL